MSRLRTVLLVALAVAGCRSAPAAPRVGGSPWARVAAVLLPPSAAQEAHDALLRADLARSDSVAHIGYVSGLASVLAGDVVYLRGGLPIIRGRAAALAVAAAESIGVSTTVRWQPVRAEASADGRSGYSYGFAIYSAAESRSPSVRVDRYIAFWRREAASWRIVAYAETYGTPPMPIAPPPSVLAAALRDAPMGRTEGALEAIRAADAAFAADAERLGAGAAFGKFAASDAQVFSAPGELLTGPEAITQSFGPASPRNTLTWHPVTGEVSESGDLGYTVGNADFVSTSRDGSIQTRRSKYLTVWKRQRDGAWRYVVDGGSARDPGMTP